MVARNHGRDACATGEKEVCRCGFAQGLENRGDVMKKRVVDRCLIVV